MRKELDEKLCADYPEIFVNRHRSMKETAMCWGFECGDGWYSILRTLCHLLTRKYYYVRSEVDYIKILLDRPDKSKWTPWMTTYYTNELLERKILNLEEERAKVPVAVQVKEKYGTLRFYVTAATDEQHAYISFAEEMSGTTCETCGTTKGVYQTDGWVQTTCDVCNKDH